MGDSGLFGVKARRAISDGRKGSSTGISVLSQTGRMVRAATCLAALVSLGACAEVSFLSQAAKQMSPRNDLPSSFTAENGLRYKIGKPYQIAGQWYYPKVDYEYSEQGIASWYGPGFDGKKTANGAIFDQDKVSAAHRTLPLPSLVRVTNLENGRSLKVLVNDRGPYAKNRIIDLSKRAAELLGYERKGTALVRIDVLPDESRQLAALMQGQEMLVGGDHPPPPQAAPSVAVQTAELAPPPGAAEAAKPETDSKPAAPEPASAESAPLVPHADEQAAVVPVAGTPQMFVQAGAFAEYQNALKTQTLLKSVGNSQITQFSSKDVPLFRVRVGPVATVEDADRLLDAVIGAGYANARIIVVD